jgi:endonuclease/exonuclease/phosphatase family metal-dependent hydrolase
MLKNRLSFLLLIFTLVFVSCTDSKETFNDTQLTVGTFNIAWLGDGIKDMRPRSKTDYIHIAEVILETGADVLSLQEIEIDDALDIIITNLDGFDYKIFEVSGSMNIALLYKDFINIEDCSVYYPLMLIEGRHRPGLYTEFSVNGFRCKMLGVHFKSTSRYDDTEELRVKSRQERSEQAEIASLWADSVLQADNIPIIIAGDFNDYPGRINDYTLSALSENDSLTFLTEGMKSCKFEYGYSIDHIAVSPKLKTMYMDASRRCYDIYSAYSDVDVAKISDHCPVTVNLDISN